MGSCAHHLCVCFAAMVVTFVGMVLTSPWFQGILVYLNYLHSTPWVDLSHPELPSVFFAGLEDTEAFTVPGPAGTIGAWHVRPRKELQLGAPPVVVLYFHGNCETRAHVQHWAPHKINFYTREMGFHVILFDYRGFGDSEGNPTEAGLTADAHTIWQYLHNSAMSMFGAQPSVWIVHGHSLGTGVLSQFLSTSPDPLPSAAVFEAPFTRTVRASCSA